MRVATTRYPADVVGSMLRPPALLEAFAGVLGGAKVPPADLKLTEDAAVDECLAIQERAGMDVVTDGEMRRQSFLASLTETVDGISAVDVAGNGVTMHWHGSDGDVDYLPPVVITDRLVRRRSLSIEEFAYARAKTTKPIKVTLPSPMMLSSFWVPGISDRAYADAFEAFREGAEILRREIRELWDVGCTYVQIDAPELATHVLNAAQRERWVSVGVDPDRLLDEGVEILDSLAAECPEMYFSLHVCRGNLDGMWLASGGYDAIAERVFPRVPHFDALALEYDTDRTGGFEPLAHVPDDKVVILGLVSTKSDELEDPQALRQRITDACRYFPRDQLALSTQCGFASAASGNPISWLMQEQKLQLVADVAHDSLG
jgi:5-methyltetrahydropteroyltriglutamate--homocysteine methyltransferase